MNASGFAGRVGMQLCGYTCKGTRKVCRPETSDFLLGQKVSLGIHFLDFTDRVFCALHLSAWIMYVLKYLIIY